MSTSQASLEVIALVGFLLVAFALIQMVYVRERNGATDDVLFLEEKSVADSLASAINLAYLGGDGYSANLTMPRKIGTYTYDVTVLSGHVYVRVNGADLSFASKILPWNVSGQPLPGNNVFSNAGGTVHVSQ